VAERIRLIEKFNDLIGNRTRKILVPVTDQIITKKARACGI
jgi:hypothetical protein